MYSTNAIRIHIELPDGRGHQRCSGPGPENICPQARGGRVPCAAGRALPLRGTWADGAWLDIPPEAGPDCPLAGLVTRRPAPWD